jgi:serine/threonine protein kinase
MTPPPPATPSEASPESEPASSEGLVPMQARLPTSSLLAGRWELLGPLGDGGTASVQRARDLQSRELVAIKMLHPEFARDKSMRERFRREGYAANMVQHPAVVKILADGEDEDKTPFLVMEYLEGETLERRLERKGGRLPATEVLWAIDKVLDVLAAAHQRGIVHRDIKPDNLFLTDDRRIKVLDFGLARLKENLGSKLTQIGFVMGTPSFMPPEQARGAWDEVDVQTDLWSVGATMYYLLSGHLVHEGTRVQDVVQAATTRTAPSLRGVAPHLPPSIIDLVDLALAFEMSKRWRGARLMQHALRQAHRELHQGEGSPDSEEDSSDEAPPVGYQDDPEPPPVSLRSEHLPAHPPAVPLIVKDLAALEKMDTLPSARPDALAPAGPPTPEGAPAAPGASSATRLAGPSLEIGASATSLAPSPTGSRRTATILAGLAVVLLILLLALVARR